MQACFTGDIGSGPVLYGPGCGCLDFDADGDVDDTDYDAFATELLGPNVPAPGCGP